MSDPRSRRARTLPESTVIVPAARSEATRGRAGRPLPQVDSAGPEDRTCAWAIEIATDDNSTMTSHERRDIQVASRLSMTTVQITNISADDDRSPE